jgi:hypothetical protein
MSALLMSLKQKNELAFRTVASAGLPAGTPIAGLTSQENQESSLAKQNFVFEDLGGPERPLRSKTYAHKVLAMVKTRATKQPADSTNPQDQHAANVLALKNALNVANLAAALSAAVDNYHVLFVMDLGETEVEPEEGMFVDGFLYEVVCLENDCT